MGKLFWRSDATLEVEISQAGQFLNAHEVSIILILPFDMLKPCNQAVQ